MDERPELTLTDHAMQRELFGTSLWSPEEVAEMYGVTVETMKNWLREKRVVGVRLGRKWYVPDVAIRKSIQNALQDAGLVRTPPQRKPRPAVVPSSNDHPPVDNMFDLPVSPKGTDQ